MVIQRKTLMIVAIYVIVAWIVLYNIVLSDDSDD